VALNLSTQATQIGGAKETRSDSAAAPTRMMLHWRPKSIYFHLLPILPPLYDEEQPQIDKPSAQSTLPSEEEVLKVQSPTYTLKIPQAFVLDKDVPAQLSPS
jgi:hypothetical protein